MYVRRLQINNIRSIDQLDLKHNAEQAAGRHVILGANCSGNSSVVRSLTLALSGAGNLLRFAFWNAWQRGGTQSTSIRLQFPGDACDIVNKRGLGTRGPAFPLSWIRECKSFLINRIFWRLERRTGEGRWTRLRHRSNSLLKPWPSDPVQIFGIIDIHGLDLC